MSSARAAPSNRLAPMESQTQPMADGAGQTGVQMSSGRAQAEEKLPAIAKRRGAASETLEWFRMQFPNAIHLGNKTIKGVFLGAHGSQHAYLSPTVAIVRLSTKRGGSKSVWDTRLRYSLETIQHGTHVGIGIGRECPISVPYPPDTEFITAGFWFMVNHWSVRDGDEEVLLVRLLHAKAGGEPWLRHGIEALREKLAVDPQQVDDTPVQQDEKENDNLTTARAIQGQACNACGKSTPMIYKERWVCGQPGCGDNGKDSMGRRITSFEYLPAFLEAHLSADQLAAPYPRLLPEPLKPFADVTDETDKNVLKTQLRELWKGSCCLRPDCRTMSRYSSWNRRVCEGCGDSFVAKPPLIPIAMQLETRPDAQTYNDFKLPEAKVTEGCATAKEIIYTDKFAGCSYELAEDCTLLLVRPKASVIAGRHGANERYDQIQRIGDDGSVKLERKLLSKGQDNVTRHTVVNIGHTYHTYTNLDSLSWEDAPAVISELRDELSEIVKEFVGVDPEFNNGTLNGYLHGMGMNAHDDGEAGLGPIVATQSYGCAAKMKFFMKTQFDCGKTGAKATTATPNNPILPGCQKEGELRTLRESREKDEIAEAEYQEELIKILKTTTKKDKRSQLMVLELLVEHGDVLIMVGKGVQNFYEVSDKRPLMMP